MYAQCLKITENVAYNIASEASYVYILSGQKLAKNAKNGQFWRVFKTWSLWSNSVTRQVTFNWIKIGGKCQKLKLEMRHFEWFSNTVCTVKSIWVIPFTCWAFKLIQKTLNLVFTIGSTTSNCPFNHLCPFDRYCTGITV